MKHFLRRINQTIYFVAVAVLCGLLAQGLAHVMSWLATEAFTSNGTPGVMLAAFGMGIVIIAIYQTAKERNAKKQGSSDIALRNYLPNYAEIDKYFKTPAGMDLAYKIVTDKTNGKRNLVSHAKPRAAVESSDNVRHIRSKAGALA
jgi:hypothetical protein